MSESSTTIHGSPTGGIFPFLAERLWLDFINTSSPGSRPVELLEDFEALVLWLEESGVIDAERADGIRRRAQQQPAGAAAALMDARRVRESLRKLAERGLASQQARLEAVGEINRVLGRSAGTRRVEAREDGSYMRSFVPVGDAFAGLMIPVVESAADALVNSELARTRVCDAPSCTHVFHDSTRNHSRRWCDMAVCGNRAKAARFRRRNGAH